LREIARREREKVKKWREKDKKQLFENVKERYLQYRKMRVNLLRIDPFRRQRRQQQMLSQNTQRKRSKKRHEKKLPVLQQQSNSSSIRREGLRSKQPGPFTITIPNFKTMPEEEE